MVFPQTSSRVDYAENVEIEGVAHNALLHDRGVFERLAGEFAKARAQASARSPTATSGSPA
jgi:hypothetical protein